MSQRAQFFHPFDVTYGEVSRKVRHFLAGLDPTHEVDWLKKIIWNFQSEADQWDYKEELGPYRDSMRRLRLNILRLAAGAYLHIAYDLPRVLADHWPGSPPNDPPNLQRGLAIYGYIGKLFSEVVNDVRTMPEVVGITRPVLKWETARRAMNIWVKTLRDAAWLHAQQLSGLSPAQRAQREREMLTVITDALERTSSWIAWDAVKLIPPDFLYDESPGETPLYLMGMPIIPIDRVNDLQLAGELFQIMISILILFFVFNIWLQPIKKGILSKKSASVSDKAYSAWDEADKEAAEFIEMFGLEINNGLKKLFNQEEQ